MFPMSAETFTTNSSAELTARPSGFSPTGEQALLEALRFMMPAEYQKFDNSVYVWDEMLLAVRSDPEKSDQVMALVGEIMRRGLSSLCFWAGAEHLPAPSKQSQVIIADLIQQLEILQLIKILPDESRSWPGLASRLEGLKPIRAKQTNLAAIPLFVAKLMKEAERRVVESWNSAEHSKKTAQLSESQVGIWNLAKFLRDELPQSGDIADDEKTQMFVFFCRMQKTEGFVFERVLWPLAKEIWPAWARDREHLAFAGGAKLSSRKRAVDGKTDFGIEKLKGQIEGEFKAQMAFSRLHEG